MCVGVQKVYYYKYFHLSSRVVLCGATVGQCRELSRLLKKVLLILATWWPAIDSVSHLELKKTVNQLLFYLMK